MKGLGQLTTPLKCLNIRGGINEATYIRMYPTGKNPPNSMGYQKFIKKECH